jgi:hypothetical protein
LGVGRGANDPIPEKFTVTTSREIEKEGQDTESAKATVKNEKSKQHIMNIMFVGITRLYSIFWFPAISNTNRVIL